ncbi:MAG: hypothetical protein WBD64_11510 [Candidatus Zixiibacteriota bacterium]
MRRISLVLIGLALGMLLFPGQSWAACPEHPNDNGECDTLYVEIWPGDDQFMPPGPDFVRFPIYVTNDIPNPVIDSIAGFVIPLCFTSSNANASAIIDPERNKCGAQDLGRIFHPSPWNLNNSIFRDLPSMEDPQELNWMMDLSDGFGPEWDTRILNLANGDNFWLSLVPTSMQDQRFKGGSRVLVASIMLTIEDTTTICIDSCFALMMHLAFSRSDAVTYIPRHFLPVCEDIHYPGGPPYFTVCPSNQMHSFNGSYTSSPFHVTNLTRGEVITDVGVSFLGSGVENVNLVFTNPPPAEHVEGHVNYDVVGHCQAGGTVTLTAWNEYGASDWCDFDITLVNNSPAVNLPHTWRALAGYTMGLKVSATDADGDLVTGIQLDAFWYEDDSLQPPTNPPSFDSGNPGLFSWAPTESETGTWIALFTATDACGAAYTRDLSIEVGTLYCGDCNAEGEINLADVIYLLSDLFKGGPPPDPVCRGDANCSGYRDVGDVVVLINYLFKYGQAPCFECCP